MSSSPIKGRGAVSAPVGRYEKTHVEDFDDGWQQEEEVLPQIETVIRWDMAKTLINKNDSPDIPHELSLNPYRGCEHGCVYCFARPSHAYLGLSSGLDFETKIFAKKNAAELLKNELANPRYQPHPISLGINTDSYQPAERHLKITRQLLTIFAQCRHPVMMITKSALIERDIDILSEMAKDNLVQAAISITSLDATLTRKLEPRAAAPARRLKIIRALSSAGIPTSVLMAPIIPAINDKEIESLLAAAADNGASGAGYIVLRLPHELKTVFYDWLDAHMPQRKQKVIAQIRQLHGGRDYNANFFTRHRGQGIIADLIARRFDIARRRHNLLINSHRSLRRDLFKPPVLLSAKQPHLF